MRREIGWRRALANAVFVLAALGLAAYGVVEVSRRHWRWQATFPARAGFPNIAGLEVRARGPVPGLDARALAAGAALRSERPRELADLMADASRSLATLDAVAVEAKQGLGEIHA